MEIHHPKVEKKGFKEYLLEFLMIFLAVTMGFFAENIREHFSDKEKEKQYLMSFKEDLSLDEIKLPRLINSIERQQIHPGDSLPFLLKHASIKTPSNNIYFLFRNMIRQQGIRIFITDRTIEQVKNAGEMRLISDKRISDSLIDYYKLVDYVAYLQEPLSDMKKTLTQDLRQLLNGYDFEKVIDSSDHLIIPSDSLYLRSVNEEVINNCLMSITEIKGLSVTLRDLINSTINKAGNIKHMIDEKYDLRDN